MFFVARGVKLELGICGMHHLLAVSLSWFSIFLFSPIIAAV